MEHWARWNKEDRWKGRAGGREKHGAWRIRGTGTGGREKHRSRKSREDRGQGGASVKKEQDKQGAGRRRGQGGVGGINEQ